MPMRKGARCMRGFRRSKGSCKQRGGDSQLPPYPSYPVNAMMGESDGIRVPTVMSADAFKNMAAAGDDDAPPS